MRRGREGSYEEFGMEIGKAREREEGRGRGTMREGKSTSSINSIIHPPKKLHRLINHFTNLVFVKHISGEYYRRSNIISFKNGLLGFQEALVVSIDECYSFAAGCCEC